MPSLRIDILRVPGHEHDLHAGPQFEGAFGEFAPAEFRHHHIGHQQIDRALVGFAQRQTLASVAGFENHVPARLQNPSGKHADHVFVFHQQNDFGALRRRGQASGRPRFLVHRLGDRRQEDREGRPLAQFGLATNAAAALLDDSQNRGQPQAGSFAGLFRREERLEDVGLHFRVHADAGVAHGHRHVAARRKVMLGRISLREGHVGRFNGQRAAVRHGVSGVQGKVHDRAADFAGVGPHLPEGGRAIDGHLDPLAHQTAQHPVEVRNDDIQVENLGLQHLPPAEGQQLLRE